MQYEWLIMRENQIWFFEIIRLEVGRNPPRVLERQFAPKSEATVANARQILMDRFEDPDWPAKHEKLKPEAIRFLNDSDKEVLRYTVIDLLREGDHGDA
jgi:hypothetical protein